LPVAIDTSSCRINELQENICFFTPCDDVLSQRFALAFFALFLGESTEKFLATHLPKRLSPCWSAS
jgi:hypothetical protein